MKGKGVNWAKSLPSYCKILNKEKNEELSSLSPFEVYYGRKSNIVTKASLENYDIESCPSESLKTPKRKDLSKHHVTAENIRKRAKSYNRKLEKRIMDKHKRRNRPPTEYRAGDIHVVLLRLRSKKGRIAPKRRHTLKGRLIARNLKTSRYKVSYTNLNSNQKVDKWISVEDMTSVTSQEEKAKRKEQEQKRQKRLQRKKFCIVLTRGHIRVLWRKLSLPLTLLKTAIVSLVHCFFLRSIGIERSPETLRTKIVKYLRENPNDSEGFPLELFAGQG